MHARTYSYLNKSIRRRRLEKVFFCILQMKNSFSRKLSSFSHSLAGTFTQSKFVSFFSDRPYIVHPLVARACGSSLIEMSQQPTKLASEKLRTYYEHAHETEKPASKNRKGKGKDGRHLHPSSMWPKLLSFCLSARLKLKSEYK